jgi:hypothetical protein
MLKIWQYKELNDGERGHFDKMVTLVSIHKNLDEEDVLNYKSKDLIDAYNKAITVSKLSEKYSDTIEICDTSLSLIEFSRLKLGQFIDLETLISDGEVKNLSKIIASLYLNHSEGGMFESEIEPYSKVNIDFRSYEIEELEINKVWGALKKYLKFRESFFKSYEIFDDPYEGVNIDELDDEEKLIYKEEIKERENNSQNQWEIMLNILSNNDITKFTDILNTNLFLCFNQLSYIKSIKK